MKEISLTRNKKKKNDSSFFIIIRYDRYCIVTFFFVHNSFLQDMFFQKSSVTLIGFFFLLQLKASSIK